MTEPVSSALDSLSTHGLRLPEGSVALVTGAGRGIGKGIAQLLARAGAAVAVNSTRLETSQPVVDAIVAEGGRAVAVPGNVADADVAQKVVDATTEAFGRLDFVINNAGITRDGLLMRMKREDFDAVLDINLGGAWNVCKASARVLTKQRSGRIINISSVVGLMGNAGQSNYAASKAGMIGLTKSLAKELASRGVLVNALAPGFIVTDMTEVLNEEQKQKLMSTIPLARLGQVEDIAAAVLFLCSPLANYITGQVLTVDGGLVM
jgi:3-oxoacyl-[acyl-carrier protein] reductase